MDGDLSLRDQLLFRPLDVAHFAPAPQPALTSLTDRLLVWVERARSRRALSRLDDRMLRDIALDRATAHNEAQKPFWQG